jgi:anthranilate phosphoribosyltransferase
MTMTATEAIRRVVEGHHLSRDEVQTVFRAMMDGELSETRKSAFLVALRMKGETAEEIAGAAAVMRERVTPIRGLDGEDLVDTCGTGGDARGTINVSTIAALVVAAAGGRVAKHGNRAVSSSCGSADVLEELGVTIDLEPSQMAEVLRTAGIAFLFAPKLHPAMASVAAVRKELGVRTIFNLLGPLTNPASARRQVLGVFSIDLVGTMAAVLRDLGTTRALVVHGADGLDEITLSERTYFAELRDGVIRQGEITPEELGVPRASLDAVRGGSAVVNARIARSILGGEEGAPADLIAVNAGAALYVAGLAESMRAGVAVARETIRSGDAGEKLDELIRVTSEVSER